MTLFPQHLSSLQTAKYLIGILLLTFVVFVFVTHLVWGVCKGSGFIDFSTRYHECNCVLSHVDPFKVWKGVVDHPEYKSYDNKDEFDKRLTVHAYSPWEYAYLMPLAILPFPQAAKLFGCLEVLALFTIWMIAWRVGYSIRRDMSDAVFLCGIALGSGNSLRGTITCGNYGLICASLVLLMIWALNKKYDVLAGVLWAFIMVKPQLGLLYVIPLLIAQKWKTIATAAAICLFSTIFPAVMTSTSPIKLILQVKDIGAPYLYLDNGNQILFLFFKDYLSKGTILLASASVGIAICVLVSWWCRKYDDWLCKFLPVAVVSLFWTYSLPHDSVLLCIPLIYCGSKLVMAQSRREFLQWLIMLCPFLMDAFYLLCRIWPSLGKFPPSGSGISISLYQFIMLSAWATSIIAIGLKIRSRTCNRIND
jgi:hypothetical protein